MNSSYLASILGLISALVWGAADFCGGLSTRRAPVLSVLILAEIAGFVLLLIAAFAFAENFPVGHAVLFSVLAGLSGTTGLGSLYRALASGRASVVAPVAAVIGAAIPAVYTSLTVGLAENIQLLGFGLAFVAIVLASQSSEEDKGSKALPFAFLAGIGFGCFFILMDHGSGPQSTFFPLAIARSFPIPIMLLICVIRKAPLLPPRNALMLVLLTGILDAAGTVLFLLSSTLGRLDVATILSSLFPASTVILSHLILSEPISFPQKLGVVLALIAIVLIVW